MFQTKFYAEIWMFHQYSKKLQELLKIIWLNLEIIRLI